MRVLVTGATGFVGGRLVPVLLDRGHDVNVLVRDPTSYDPPDGVDVFTGDLLDPGSFDDALVDVEAAYYLVHSMGSTGDFAERDRRAASNFATAASDAGVDRAVYLGGLGEDDDGQEEELSAHLRSRREVERVLAEAAYDLTTLRAAVIIGRGSASFEMIRQLDRRLPIMVTPRWVNTPCQPIAIDDVIAYLAGLLDVPETAGDTYEIGGPEVLDYATIMRRTAGVMGRRKPIIIGVPVLTPELSAYWIGLVTDVPTSVARPLIHGLKTPVVADDDRIRDLIPLDLTPFDESVERALADDGSGATQEATPSAEGEE